MNTAPALGVTIGVGAPCPFNSPQIVTGGSISIIDDDSFSLNEIGFYRVEFVAYPTTLSLLGGARVFIDGSAVGHQCRPQLVGVPLVVNAIIEVVSPPVVLEIRITGLSVSLASGTSASMDIVKLSTN